MRDLREDLCSARTKLESLQKESDGIAPKGDLDRSLRRLAGDDLPVGLEAVSQALQSSMLSVATTEATKIGAQRRKDIDSLKAGFQRLFVKQSDTPSAAKRKKVDDKETTRNQKRKTSDDPPPQPRGFARWSNNDVSDLAELRAQEHAPAKENPGFPTLPRHTNHSDGESDSTMVFPSRKPDPDSDEESDSSIATTVFPSCTIT